MGIHAMYAALALLCAHQRAASALPGYWLSRSWESYGDMPKEFRRELAKCARNHGFACRIMDQCLGLKAKRQ